MILMTVSREDIDDERLDILNFSFDTLEELKSFVNNNINHTMQTFSKSVYNVYDVHIGLSFIDCKASEWNSSHIVEMMAFYDSNYENELAELYKTSDTATDIKVLHDEILEIPSSALDIMKNITDACKWMNN